MENDDGMDELVDIILGKKFPTHEEKIAQNSSLRALLLSEDFSKKLDHILFFCKLTLFHKWRNYFDVHICKVLSSHEQYLTCLMAACLLQKEHSIFIFDTFFCVCTLVMLLNEEILQKTGVDFHDLNSDIIMVFYRNVLKKKFYKRKGFSRFVEYIHNHRYLKWNRNDLISSSNPTSPVGIQSELINSMLKECKRFSDFPEISSDTKVSIHDKGISMAREVLATTTAELPTLPNEPDLIARLAACKENEIVKIPESQTSIDAALTFETLNGSVPGHWSSNSESKDMNPEKHQENIEQYEDIIQAVMRHNHSKNAVGRENENNKILEETEGFLEHLENATKSLIEFLDQCDEE